VRRPACASRPAFLNPNLCNNVTIQGLSISSPGPNTDGCDPESCNGVVIDNVTFNTGDDCIAIKSGRDADGRRPTGTAASRSAAR
jgi:polygalacturonase